jgi:hypothetical protein
MNQLVEQLRRRPHLPFRGEASGFRVWVEGQELRVKVLGFGVWGLGFRVWGLRLGVKGLGCGV